MNKTRIRATFAAREGNPIFLEEVKLGLLWFSKDFLQQCGTMLENGCIALILLRLNFCAILFAKVSPHD